MTLVLLFTSPLFGGRIQSSRSIFRRRNVFTTVRFFSLLSRLFLLERGAKREKQPPLPDYFCFQVVVVVQTTARGKSFLLSFSDEANSNTTRRIESLGKRFEFSLLFSLSYSVRKSALFPVLLLSFASFESAFEKNHSVQTPLLLLLLLLFVVLVFVLLLKHTNTSNWSREKKSEFLSRFLLFFFSRANSFSLSSVVFRLCFFYSFASFVLSFVLSLHIFFVRENTHNINNTRPKIMVRSLYT